MQPETFLLLLSIAPGALGYISRLSPLSQRVSHHPAVRQEIRDIKAKLDQMALPFMQEDLPSIPDRLKGCFHGIRFVGGETNRTIHVEPVKSFTDHRFAGGQSEPVEADIQASRATVDTSTSAWNIQQSAGFQAGGSARGSIAWGLLEGEASGALSFGQSVLQIEGKSERAQSFTRSVTTKWKCPAQHACSVETWTFRAVLDNNCPLMPAVDPVCLCSNYKTQAGNEGKGCFDEFPALKDKGFLTKNVSFPSVHKGMHLQDPVPLYEPSRFNPFSSRQEDDEFIKFKKDFEKYREQFYTIAKKDGSPADASTPAEEESGIVLPAKDQFQVDFKSSPCSLNIPLFDAPNQPYSIQLMVERKLEDDASRPNKKRAPGNSEPVRVFVIGRSSENVKRGGLATSDPLVG